MTAPVETNTPRSQKRLRFRLSSLLWLAIVIALSLTCFMLTRQLRDARAVIARNSWASGTATIPAGKFRLMVNDLIVQDDLKVIVLRLEANEPHFITADGSGSATTPNENGDGHWAEIRIVVSYDASVRRLSTLTQTKSASGWAGGKSVYPVALDQNPTDYMAVDIKPGIYDLQQALDLYRKPDGTAALTVK